MTSIIFPLILLGGILIFGVIFFIVIKKQEADEKTKKKSENVNKETINSSKDTKKSNGDIKKEDVFKFMEFDRILDDMIVQNNGTKYTMAIKCKGINYDLMSEVEQYAVEEGFITFLNTIKYPIQLYVQAQNVDLKGAISTYKKNIEGIKNEYDQASQDYTRVTSAFDSTKEEIAKAESEKAKIQNVYEYASDIINYVEKMSLNKNLLQRNFYVLVSYYSSEISSSEKFSKEEIENICFNELYTRAQSIVSGLASCSVTGTILDSNQLADLLYVAYNRDDKSLMSVKEAIDSGFYRLYSTSKDVFMKKEEKLNKEIDEAARYRAIEAVRKSIKDGTYESPYETELDVEESVSRLANEYIRNDKNLDPEVSERAQQKIIDDYRTKKEDLLNKMAIEKEVLLNGNIENDKIKYESDNLVTKDSTSINQENNNSTFNDNIKDANIQTLNTDIDSKSDDTSRGFEDNIIGSNFNFVNPSVSNKGDNVLERQNVQNDDDNKLKNNKENEKNNINNTKDNFIKEDLNKKEQVENKELEEEKVQEKTNNQEHKKDSEDDKNKDEKNDLESDNKLQEENNRLRNDDYDSFRDDNIFDDRMFGAFNNSNNTNENNSNDDEIIR